MKFGLAFASSVGTDPQSALEICETTAPTLRLGTGILIVPQRNPLVMAKKLATLGVGCMREEFDALGIAWERRGARNDEHVAAMRALWAGPHAEHHGENVIKPHAS